MPDPACCQEVAERLRRHGMPAWRIGRVTDELAEHWEDLRAAAVEQGLPPSAAAAEADERLGKPERLAAGVIEGLRRSSWLGRHPILGVCVIPLLLPLLLMAVVIAPLALLEPWIDFPRWIGDGRQTNAYFISAALLTLRYGGVIATVTWLCWRAWERGLGVRWILAACAWCALAALLCYFNADPVRRNAVLALSFPFQLNIRSAVLLLIHALPAVGFLLAVRGPRKRSPEPIQETCLP